MIRIAWLIIVLAPMLTQCTSLFEAVQNIQIEKTYANWGPLACESGWKCDGTTCCTYCNNLDTSEIVLRCHALRSPLVILGEWYGKHKED